MTVYNMKLDIDSKHIKTTSTKLMIDELKQHINTTKMCTKRINEMWCVMIYKTNHGWHVYITSYSNLKIPTPRSIIKMQLMLMSDPNREAHNILRINKRIKKWNVLFKDKFEIKTHWWSSKKYLKNTSSEKLLYKIWM